MPHVRFLRQMIKTVIPLAWRQELRRLAEAPFVRRIAYFGFTYYCPVCRSRLRRFLDYSESYRNVICPFCEVHPRHRLMWLYLRRKRLLSTKTPLKLLHVAPEKTFVKAFASAPNIDYLSADLDSPLAMVRMDITQIKYPDDTFDAIYCSHVLEHIPDDRQAMRELCRVLKPGGWAILQVPIADDLETTFEDWSVQTREERARVFGQWDHVRWYGRDYQPRLENAGFLVTIDWFVKSFSESKADRLGLDRNEAIYFCRKPSSPENTV